MTPIARAPSVAEPNPQGAELNRVCIAFTATAALFVAFRIGIRGQRKVLGLDDLWIVIALASSIILTVTVAVSVGYGYGMHESNLAEEDIVNALLWWYLVQIFYKCVTWNTKISILLMYRRVFGATTQTKVYGVRFKTLIWTTIAVVAGSFISFETAGIFACSPVQRSWNSAVPGTCLSRPARFYAHVAANFITDLMVLAMPIPLINGLNVPLRQKWSLMAVFLLGGFVCITTLIRVDKLDVGTDITYSGTPSVLWSCIEANVGIICACLPLMRPLINWLVPWFAQRRPSSPGPYHFGYRTYNNNTNHRSQTRHENLDLGDKGDTFFMSRIEARDRDADSMAGSEVAITQGIHKKVEVETSIEPADFLNNRDSDKESRRSEDRKGSDTI